MYQGAGRATQTPVDRRTAEQRATAKLLAVPPPVPEHLEHPRSGTSRVAKRQRKLLDAHDNLFRRREWVQEVMRPHPQGDIPSESTTSLRERIVQWRSRGAMVLTHEEARAQALRHTQRCTSLPPTRRQHCAAPAAGSLVLRPAANATTPQPSVDEPLTGLLIL